MNTEFPFGHFLRPSLENEDVKEFPLVQKVSSTERLFNTSELTQLNKNILDHFKSLLSDEKFNTLFKSTLTLQKVSSTEIEFHASTTLIKDMLEQHHLPQLKKAIHLSLGKDYKISISIGKTIEEKENDHEQTPPLSAKEASFTLDLNPSGNDLLSKVESKYINHVKSDSVKILVDTQKTFESFTVGPSNTIAHATSKRVAQRPGKDYPCLYIHSHSGLGKTHLLQAIANKIGQKEPGKTIGLVTAREFSDEMVKAFQQKKIVEFRRLYSASMDVLMIDDIHELKGKPTTQNELSHIFDELRKKGHQLVFTSNRPPQEISGLSDSIISRLQGGLVLDIKKPDLETRMKILKTKINNQDLFIPDDVMNYIACHIKTNIRELEGVLIKLSAYAQLMEVEIDMEMVQKLVFMDQKTKSSMTMEDLVKVVADYFKISPATLKSKDRAKNITWPRHVAMYLSKNTLHISQREIGEYFNRKHTSVRHAINKVILAIKSEPEYSKDVRVIEEKIS